MKKPKNSLLLLFSISGLVLVSLYSYLAVLGENNKSIEVAKTFIEEIKNNNYNTIENIYSKDSLDKFSSVEELMNFHFHLELSLLKFFQIADEKEYIVAIERQNLWFPIIRDEELKMSITLKPTSEQSVLPSFKKYNEIDNLLTMIREEGHWKVKSINIKDSPIFNIYNDIKSKYKANQYIETTANGLIIKQIDINTKNLDILEKKVIIHNLETVIEMLKVNDN